VRKGVGKTPVGYTFIVVWGEERNNTDGEQTTKTWEADDTR
jgi:hypothetical protein